MRQDESRSAASQGFRVRAACLYGQGHDALRARCRCRRGPARSGRSRAVHRERPRRAADDDLRARLAGLLDDGSRGEHQPCEVAAWRAAHRTLPTAAARRHGRAPISRNRRQGPRPRQGRDAELREAVDGCRGQSPCLGPLGLCPARRRRMRRLWRSARIRPALTRARARSRHRSAHPRAPGAALPAQRRL